ncbi:MAG: tRNA (N(6)-L-threonylcarbamoyladenosine(37)-C(2))-methylthiotransferase [Thermoplasmata archaeon]|nr:tRNA (N(6)-L-threonylcarbamoyladenosine(37)-C(2))-methylthiotransferase [Thermoplasmata archaeon]
MRAYVESYGCTLNHGEAAEMEALLRSRGWEIAKEPEGADLALLVACVVIESTERRMLKRAKALSSVPRLIVTGCLATARKEAAEEEVPNAEFVPPGDIDSLSALIDSVGPRVRDCASKCGYAIVPIASGCMGNCSYCITRLARGTVRSRPPETIVKRISDLAKGGPIEVRLTSQDAAVYGLDIGTDLINLMERICSKGSDFRLRVGMMNPRNALPIADRLAEVFRDPKVFKFLHLPLQSGSDRLLAKMGRGHGSAEFEEIVHRMRSKVPELTLSTDIIVGYPGEEDSDHEASVSMIRRLRPDIVNVTRFSPRPGTEAATQGPVVGGRVAKARSRELTKLRFETALENNRAIVGETMTALSTERGRGSSTLLRNGAYRQIVIPEPVALREFYEVSILDATPTHLVGSLL